VSKRRLMPSVTYWTLENIDEFKYLQLIECSQKLPVLKKASGEVLVLAGTTPRSPSFCPLNFICVVPNGL
jgi:hypothetical protein